jgi:pyruvate kinase
VEELAFWKWHFIRQESKIRFKATKMMMTMNTNKLATRLLEDDAFAPKHVELAIL